jgi:hypothetical protein
VFGEQNRRTSSSLLKDVRLFATLYLAEEPQREKQELPRGYTETGKKLPPAGISLAASGPRRSNAERYCGFPLPFAAL